jgi:broad specificity phosphatase PhoE
MKKAALYVHGRIIIGFNHGDAFGKLTEIEQHEFIVSGFYDPDTEEFEADSTEDHFYDKDIYLIRHAKVQDQDNPDTQISEAGAKQVEKLGSFLLRTLDLKEYTFLTSPFLRCLQTAQILHQVAGLKFEVVPNVMETPTDCCVSTFCLKNHKDQFPEFEWPTSQDWHLKPETPETFLDRTRQTLHGLPHKAMIVTHFGTIFNMARLSLCDNKASTIAGDGLPPASVISINRKKMERLGYEDDS